MGQSIKAWIGAAAVVAFLIAIAGWFLLISPTRAATADARANIDSEASRTVTLSEALKTLKAQYANLDATRAALADVSVQVPTKADDSAFRRVLADRAATAGVTVMTLNTGAATPVTQPATSSGGTSGDGTAGSSTATPSPSPSPSPSAAPSAANSPALQTASGQVLVGVPLEMTVVGTYDSARAFIASLQGVKGRLFLIYGLNLVSQPDATGSGGRPDTVKGDVELSIQGYLLVLTPGPDDAVVSSGPTPSPAPSAGPTPSPSPLPSTERNPFAPIASPAP